MAKREEEIRAFKPEPYWLVEARFEASGERRYVGRYLGGRRLPNEDEATAVVTAVEGNKGEITKLEKKEEIEQPQLLYDLTSLQRHANNIYGFSARRTLSAAQRLYEEHKALTYPRTNSRYLTGDMVPEIKPTAELVGHNPQYTKGAEYVIALDQLPLQRVVNDKKVQDHHAIIPTRSEHDLGKMGQDELKVYDLVAKRFLAIFHPEAKFERTRVETTVVEHVFRTSGRRLVEPGWKAVYGSEAEPELAEDDSGGDQLLPRLDQGETVDTSSVESIRKETQPPRRYTDASLLGAMETAGKEAEDAEVREAMKDSGIGTPATRAAIIERLVTVGYLEREGRSLIATEKAIQVVRLLGEHQLTSPELTGSWERRLRLIEQGEDTRPAFMKDIAAFTTETVQELDKLKGVKIERAKLGPVPGLRPRDHREPQGLLVLVARGPRLRLRDLEEEGGQEPPGGRGQGADREPARSRASAARTRAWAGPRSRSPASAAAPDGPSAPSSGSSRSRRASGAWSSTRSGRRSRPRARPRRSAPRPRRRARTTAPRRRPRSPRRRPRRRAPSRTAPRPPDQTAGAGSVTPSSTFSIRGGPASSSLTSVPGQ